MQKIFSLEDLSLPTNNASVFLNRVNVDDHAFLTHKYKLLLEKGYILQAEFRCEPDKYVSCDAYYLEDTKTIIGTVKDITRAKEHADYMVNYGGQKDTLLEIICHNLSGPLMLMQNVIRKAEKTATGNIVNGTPDVYPFINDITQQCIDIINDFLEKEHFESEKIFPRKNHFDVVEKVRLIIENSKKVYESKHIHLDTEHEYLFVHSDDVKFLQVLNNLISNAMKFTQTNGNIVVGIRTTEDTFIVSIADDGIGISPQMQPFLFERNSIASRPGLRGEASNGIGLYICKRLVDRMQGRLWYDTIENNGSTFYMELPRE
ncbi:MAG TPA: HAMP domain-containing sensor histidine kinase [Ohtaekwangia sp.]